MNGRHAALIFALAACVLLLAMLLGCALPVASNGDDVSDPSTSTASVPVEQGSAR